MPEASDIAGRLEAAFAKIHAERMEGVPILNPRLEVEAVGTREWNGHWLAVLITPWFINLMLLPASQEQAWSKLPLGSTMPHRFPSGRFDFLIGEESGIGRYQMCSLFSPVLEFADQEAARLAGQAALEALFDEDLDDSPAKSTKAAVADGSQSTDEPPSSGVTRRGLLRGKLVREEGPA
jgi:[NiFe] hydrogenase assembly HybE family chaperone